MTSRRRRLSVALICALLVTPLAAVAQKAKPVARIGYLGPDPQTQVPQIAAFKNALRTLGFEDGRNVAIEYRSPGQQPDRLPALAAELVAANVDVILAVGPPAVAAAQRATSSIPIVMVSQDAVAMGFVASLGRPGGNITGVSFQEPELAAKRLDFLRQAVPGITRVAVLWNKQGSQANTVASVEAAARARKIQVLVLELREVGEFADGIARAKAWGAQGVVQLASPYFFVNRAQLIELLGANRLPASCEWRHYVVEGCLMTYSPSLTATFSRLAHFVARILKGANPADLPIEQPIEFDLAVNATTATALGLVIPTALQLQVTELLR